MSQVERDHKDFAKHIVNEKEVEVVKKGVKVREWQKQGANHYLDAAVYSVVAAVKEGIKLPGLAAKPTPETVSLSGGKERPTRESLARYW
jgi:phage terminase large subunit GpA-like protein